MKLSLKNLKKKTNKQAITPDTKSIEFLENETYENGFAEFYNKNLKKIYSEYLLSYHNKRNILNQRFSWLVIAIFGSLILSALFIFSPIQNYYLNLVDNFEHMMSMYVNWRNNLPRFIQLLLPSRLIFWSFPTPVGIMVITIIVMSIRYVVSVFSLRSSIKLDVMLKIFNFMGNFEHNYQNNIQKTKFYNALALPAFDKFLLANGSFSTQYQDIKLEACEIKISTEEELYFSLSYQKTIFKGLILVADLAGLLNNKTQNIFLANPDKEIINKLNKYSKIKLIQPNPLKNDSLSWYSSDPKELKEDNIKKILDIILTSSEILNKYNQPKDKSWDDVIISSLRGEKDYQKILSTPLQVAIYEEKLFILIPLRYDLFGAPSILSDEFNHDDVHLILASLNFSFKLIDQLLIK